MKSPRAQDCTRASTRDLALPLLVLLLALLGCAADVVDDAPSEEVIRHNTRGTAFLGQQKWAEAEVEFRKAAVLAPRDPLPLNNIAVAKIQQGEIEPAEQALGQALQLDPGHPYVHYNMGQIEKNRGNFDAAAKHFEAVAAHDPLDLLTQYNLGVVYSRTERDEDARRAFQAALDRDPSHVSTLYGLGRLLLQKGDQAEGEHMVSLSQEIRARSGLDQAVGSQYGEQGPYAMGIDYSGALLSAPPSIAVTFEGLAHDDTPSDHADLSWAIVRTDSAVPATLLYGAGKRIRRLSVEGAADVAPEGPGTVVALAAGNVDQDAAVELLALVAGPEGLAPALLRGSPAKGYAWQTGNFDGTGNDLTSVPTGLQADLTLLDRDHDGDLDAFWCWTSDSGADCALATGDGQGNFQVRPSTNHGFRIPGAAKGLVRVAFSDIDNDRDIDLLVGEAGGVHLFTNRRDDTYADVSATSGLGAAIAGGTALEIADLNKDGFMDLVLGGPDGVRLLLNRGGSFDAPQTPAGDAGASSVMIADYDNDGFLDVLVSRAGAAPLAVRGLGRGAFDGAPAVFGQQSSGQTLLAAYDADLDGDLDLATRDAQGRVALLSNQGGNANHWIAIDSTGVGDNTQGVGSKVEILAGALRQKFEVQDGRSLHAGLGGRDRVESVRYLWPSGVLQDELDQPAGGTVQITQLDRKGTSCPLLYARDASGWRFVTDFLGGAAVGSQRARGVFGLPDSDEYIKVEGGIVADDDGTLRLRINNQLEEVLWFDQVELLVVDHPAGSEVFPNERLLPGPPWPEHRLYAGTDIRPVVRASVVETGLDLTATLRETDGIYAEPFRQLPYKGYAETHTLELDLGRFPADRRAVLLLDGFIDYADSSSNIAAEHAGVALLPPLLSVGDGRDGWTAAPQPMGFPAGLPKTMSVDLSGLFDRSGSARRVRIATNMRIYWDRVRVLVGGEDTPLSVRRVGPRSAELRFGGFPRPIRPRGSLALPLAYDPNSVALTAGWKAHVGAYTAFGDVLDRLDRLDDRMVTTRNGDEIELAFRSPGPVPAGSSRTFIFFADGFGKDMDPNSAAADEVGPVPFHSMPEYPYGAGVVPPLDSREPSAPARLVLPSAAGWPGAPPPVSTSDARRGS